MNDIYTKELSGELVSPDEPGYEHLIDDIFSTMETAQELATVSVRDQKRVHELMEIILGEPLDESTTLLPPLYIDYGKPVKIGKECFIQQCCTFFGRGGITIGDGSIVEAQSVVIKDVPPMTVVAGNPARIIKMIDL